MRAATCSPDRGEIQSFQRATNCLVKGCTLFPVIRIQSQIVQSIVTIFFLTGGFTMPAIWPDSDKINVYRCCPCFEPAITIWPRSDGSFHRRLSTRASTSGVSTCDPTVQIRQKQIYYPDTARKYWIAIFPGKLIHRRSNRANQMQGLRPSCNF